ncbi:hypothetical protein M3221_03435 [Domibacillus indicus]|uniref:hypothetical protein n=1 Tax=Domibacillus indicus TaxID=1437523 RepID=UPI00203E536F|nr:hypothetical protein [Domibacillus indicus]MCM3787467.1 hypothetical protein [Domibacillus indicus]
METNQEIDLSITYNIREFPDIKSGRCNNCGNAHFKSSIKNMAFLHECRSYGMKKII